MFLAVDIGNSNIVFGGYIQGELRFSARVATDLRMETDQYAALFSAILELHGVGKAEIRSLAMSSVVPSLNRTLTRALAFFTDAEPHMLSLADAGDVEVAIDNPAELGMDILACAVAVRHSRPLPAVIIDMGTATKLTALDDKWRLLGVAIAPGLYVSQEALVSRTSLLQGISFNAPPSAIGRNTKHSMQSGLVLGAAAMLEGMIERFSNEMGGVKSIVATGGGVEVVVPHCRVPIEVWDTLLLDGIYKAVCQK